MFTPDQVKALEAPLNAEHVKTRSQAGRSLSYIEGWQAIKEANRIFGFDCWDRETVELRQLGEAYQDQKSLWRVAYFAKVRIKVRTAGAVPPTLNEIVREGCGYGSGIDWDLGSAHESALKEAETDAMKRALMTFGNPFGLALYDKAQAEVDRAGSSEVERRAVPAQSEAAGSSPAPSTKPDEWPLFDADGGTIGGYESAQEWATAVGKIIHLAMNAGMYHGFRKENKAVLLKLPKEQQDYLAPIFAATRKRLGISEMKAA